jgi:hypothetical protein
VKAPKFMPICSIGPKPPVYWSAPQIAKAATRRCHVSSRFAYFVPSAAYSLLLCVRKVPGSNLCRTTGYPIIIVIIIIIISGVRLSPLGTAATIGLLYQPWMIDDVDYGAVGGMKTGRGNRSTRRKSAWAPLCPAQISHDLTRARTRVSAVGSQLLTAWAMARPTGYRNSLFVVVLSLCRLTSGCHPRVVMAAFLIISDIAFTIYAIIRHCKRVSSWQRKQRESCLLYKLT